MPALPRNLPHLFTENNGQPEAYVSPAGGNTSSAPARERALHADALLRSLNTALAQIQTGLQAERAPGDTDPSGFMLEFRMPAGAEKFVQKLEDRRQHIELLSVSNRGGDGLVASVYVPMRARNHFLRKIESYRDEETRGGRPKNEPLISRVERVALGAFDSVYTDQLDALPPRERPIWWEVWLRSGHRETFQRTATRLELRLSAETIIFPERDVVLAFGLQTSIGRSVVESGVVAEIRVAKDAPSTFLGMPNNEQREWVDDVIQRLIPPDPDAVAVCVLDSGVTRTHPLLSPALAADDVHKYDPNWPDGDSASWNGHGTAMAGLGLYGDLFPILLQTVPVRLGHRLESVKMLAHDGAQHEPRLYGAITRECAARPEVVKPHRPRIHCLAITSETGTNRGRPSSWSAAIDQIAFGDDRVRRLVVLAAGNIRNGIDRTGYPNRNDVEPIENPAQAWNALTVGAYTAKDTLVDRSFRGWSAIAPAGGIAPCSRTSVAWERKWPVKPDIVLEGGNWADLGMQVDRPDDLSVLTSHYRPNIRHFEAFGDTSAAASLSAQLAARILTSRPDAWPETVRALVVHSAEWSPVMQAHMDEANNQTQKATLLRRYGYGVPRLDRALLSSLNDATIVLQETLRPLRLDGSQVKSQNMNLHRLPWPTEQLAALGTTSVQLRVTLSYFIEPNPGERGWYGRYRYPSHSLRFSLKRGLESLSQFRARINRAVTLEDEDLAETATPEDDNWYLGRIRDVGSIHSDIWIGSAAELSRRDALAVFPIGGWWKEKPQLQRYNRDVRYTVCVSLRALEAQDIYTPIATALHIPVETVLTT
jgi:Subtilase family